MLFSWCGCWSSHIIKAGRGSILCNLFIQTAAPVEITPGGSSDEQAHGTELKYTASPVTAWGCWDEEVCCTVILLPTHARPVSESDFLEFSVRVKCIYANVSERTRVSACQTQRLLFSAQAADLSAIISWIVLHAQHLSQTHTSCLCHTHKHSHYIVITVRLMLYSPL